MSKASPFIIGSLVAAVVFASHANADGSAAGSPDPSLRPTANEVAAAGPIIATIRDKKTSIVQVEPKCGNGSTLRGELVMETPPRAGFPFSATTVASPHGTFTSLTTTGDESEAVVNEVATILNARADNYVKQLLRSCSI